MTDDFASHVGSEHPEISTYPEAFIRSSFDFCPYCGIRLDGEPARRPREP